jgi:hypothetical protein
MSDKRLKIRDLSDVTSWDIIDMAVTMNVDMSGRKPFREIVEEALLDGRTAPPLRTDDDDLGVEIVDSHIGGNALARYALLRLRRQRRGERAQVAMIRELKALQSPRHDTMTSHARADRILCELLIVLGYDSIVAEWEKVDKFYG